MVKHATQKRRNNYFDEAIRCEIGWMTSQKVSIEGKRLCQNESKTITF